VPYAVEFARSVENHFRALTARDRTTVIAAINRQLRDEPLKEARHRKPLRPNPIAPWELRVGQLRVFYEVVGAGSGMVRILAVGRKTAQHTSHRWKGDTAVKRLRLSSAVRPLADYVADFRDETVVLTEGNRAVAAIVPLKNVDRESLALSQHPEFLELIARSRAEFAAGRTLSLEEMTQRVLPKRSPNKRMQPTARRARRG